MEKQLAGLGKSGMGGYGQIGIKNKICSKSGYDATLTRLLSL